MEINYLAILVSAVLAMVLGAIWYGPLFGKKWMQIVGVSPDDMDTRKRMQQSAMPLYLIQLLLVLFQLYVLAHFIAAWEDAPGVETALWVWAGFIMPTVAAGSMWNNDSAKISWARFLIQAGYQLVLFVMFGIILGMWR